MAAGVYNTRQIVARMTFSNLIYRTPSSIVDKWPVLFLGGAIPTGLKLLERKP